jgi:imidazolonepropionase-like amidohydrolase
MQTRIDASLLIPGAGSPIQNGSVVMNGDTISYAGPTADAPSGADTITTVTTAMPGLWECHGHYTGMGGGDLERDVIEPLARRAGRAVVDIGRTLMGGVTTVREVGGLGIQLRHLVHEGSIPGPAIYSAGHILSTTGGHADVHGLPLDWVDASADRIGYNCDGVSGCLKGVRRQLRDGAAVIKVCASGGVMSEIDHPIHQQFSDEELRTIVEEAGRADRVVAAHCHGKPGIMAALRAGARTIEHGSYLDEEAAEAMIEAGAVYVPTRYILSDLLDKEDMIPTYAYRKLLMVADHHELALKTAIAAGVTIAMGTDLFMSGEGHGTNSTEIRYLVDAGLTPLEAIDAATVNGPLTLGPQAPLSGRIVEGHDADVIALDFDPLADVSAWGDPDRVTHVWKSGRLVKGTAGTATTTAA